MDPSWSIDHIVYKNYSKSEFDIIAAIMVEQEQRATEGASSSHRRPPQCRTFI